MFFKGVKLFMQILFYGAAGCVTGSCSVIDTGSCKIMIDCGLFQGKKEIKELNYQGFSFNPREINCLLLTHAHIDHSGLLPKLFKHGFRGPVYATSATFDLCSAMLPDSAHIQETEVERKNRKLGRAGLPLLQPIYTVEDAVKCLELFVSLNYERLFEVAPGVSARFRDAGHILGSAIIEIWLQTASDSVKVVFSGDLGNPIQPLINDPVSIDHADYVIMESTYGNRIRPKETDNDTGSQLEKIIKETFQRGGNVIVPAFAVERTQDLLYQLSLLVEQGRIRSENIYIDSPLAVTATEIFCRNTEYFNPETQALVDKKGGKCPLYLPGLRFARTVEESIALNQIRSGAIIISASGMCDAGRIKHHLKHNLWRPESTILFVGYQASGTLGRRILDGEKEVRIHGEPIAVKASIQKIESFSAHADQNELLSWINNFKSKPKKVFITHGEPESSQHLRDLLQKQGQNAQVPKLGEAISLTSASQTETVFSTQTNVVSIEDQVYRTLEAITNRLRKQVDTGLSLGNHNQVLMKLSKIEEIINQK